MIEPVHRIVPIFFVMALAAFADEKTGAVRTLIPWLLDKSDSLKGIPFSEVIAAASGKRVLPIDRTDKDTQRILAEIGRALDEVLGRMNAPDNPVRNAKRVNEMSSHFENALRETLNKQPGFTCAIPKTQDGRTQRSGYPDLRLADAATRRVFYVDPKLYAAGSRSSSLRTFYFEPKRATNKVNDDAAHLIAGIEHERDKDGAIHFTRWELIDLANFRVKLKAEFEASNADLYRPEAVVGSSSSSSSTSK
jgi:hypothetical protein